MAVLNKEFNSFHSTITLSKSKKDGLIKSRDAIRKRIRNWFKENKPDELQPSFRIQGSFAMKTTVNPIVIKKDDKKLYKYDLDDGVYFVDKSDSDRRKSITTWHNWVLKAVDQHTGETTKDKTTCIRVMFADGHHIDLPIYYKQSDSDADDPELAHKSKDWLVSDPRAFFNWFNDKAKDKPQLRKIVRYLKAWKNNRETEVSSLKLPSGFAITILATDNFVECDNDDESFRKTVTAIKESLDLKYECLRPTIPKNEDIFEDDTETFKRTFLSNLKNLIRACEKAHNEKNFKKASEYLQKQFGERFPLGKDEDEKSVSSRLSDSINVAPVKPKPFLA